MDRHLWHYSLANTRLARLRTSPTSLISSFLCQNDLRERCIIQGLYCFTQLCYFLYFLNSFLFIFFCVTTLPPLPPQFQPLLHYKNSSLIMPSRNRWPRQVAHLYTHKTFKQKQNGGNMTGSFFRDFPSTPPHLLQCPASNPPTPHPPQRLSSFCCNPPFYLMCTPSRSVSLSLSLSRVWHQPTCWPVSKVQCSFSFSPTTGEGDSTSFSVVRTLVIARRAFRLGCCFSSLSLCAPLRPVQHVWKKKRKNCGTIERNFKPLSFRPKISLKGNLIQRMIFFATSD